MLAGGLRADFSTGSYCALSNERIRTRTENLTPGEARFRMFCGFSPRILHILLFLHAEVEWVVIFPFYFTLPPE
jgi:hypothetical protein